MCSLAAPTTLGAFLDGIDACVVAVTGQPHWQGNALLGAVVVLLLALGVGLLWRFRL